MFLSLNSSDIYPRIFSFCFCFVLRHINLKGSFNAGPNIESKKSITGEISLLNYNIPCFLYNMLKQSHLKFRNKKAPFKNKKISPSPFSLSLSLSLSLFLSLSLYIYIWIYICVCVSVCVCLKMKYEYVCIHVYISLRFEYHRKCIIFSVRHVTLNSTLTSRDRYLGHCPL